MTEPAARPSIIRTGISSRCPRCGQGRLFAGFLQPATACNVCGLDYGFIDSGDGPAVFIIFVAGAIIMLSALIVDALFHPPAYIHLMLWIPATIGLCLALLRPFKATMIALQYRNDAGEDRQ